MNEWRSEWLIQIDGWVGGKGVAGVFSRIEMFEDENENTRMQEMLFVTKHIDLCTIGEKG